MNHTRVLITGTSTRAAADSAARAGFDVVSLDAFADLDQHPSVQALSLRRDFGIPFTPRRAGGVARTISSDAVVYLSSFENAPTAVDALAAGRTLWGNGSSVLRRVRDPFELMRALRRSGFDVPVTLRGPVVDADPSRGLSSRWLLKPRASGGGHGVGWWTGEDEVPRGHYVQAYVEGAPGSVVFVAARGHAVPLVVSRQLIGDAAFGASRFQYCGSILAHGQFDRHDDLWRRAADLTTAVAREFGLTGVGSIDFIASDGVPYPIEVNPRWTASMELVERAHGQSMFGLHAAACAVGRLPSFAPGTAAVVPAVGKAIVFAREDVVAGDTRLWLEDPSVRDVPHPGEPIAAGQPVCTVFAGATDARSCYEELVGRADRIYRELARNCSTSLTTSSGCSSLG